MTPVFNAVPPPVLLLFGMISLQVGAAYAKQLFQVAGPSGTAALRMVFAATILLAIWRRALRMDRRTLAVAASYGVVLASMNISLYHAMDRIPLGAAVTIEFLGPLTVAAFGSRRRMDILWVILAALGVLLLGRMGGGLAMGGVCFALLAAAFWAGYILLGAKLGSQTSGGSGLALGMVFGSLVAVPLGAAESGATLIHPTVLVAGLVVALMSSVIPYSLEFEALRRMPLRTFGILMSLEPAVATVAGLVVLGEMLTLAQWLAVGCVTVASIGATRGNGIQDDKSSGRRRAKSIQLRINLRGRRDRVERAHTTTPVRRGDLATPSAAGGDVMLGQPTHGRIAMPSRVDRRQQLVLRVAPQVSPVDGRLPGRVVVEHAQGERG